jgi:FkbM family methyltransferase
MSLSSSLKILVLGNGPSLKPEHFELFRGMTCLGMNAAYRYWREIDWYPQVYCCLDDQVVNSHADAIAQLVEEGRCRAYFLHEAILKTHDHLRDVAGVYFLPQLRTGERSRQLCDSLGIAHAPSDLFKSTNPGKLTTGAYALRFAAFLGFREIGLVGTDCRYVEVIDEAVARDGIALEIATTPARNLNYFFDGYQVQGDRYNIPNPAVHGGNLHLQAFEVLRDDIAHFQMDMQVRICTTESELYDKKVFEHIPLERFIKGPELSAVFVPFVERDLPRLLANLSRWGQQPYAPEIFARVPSVELHFAYHAKRDPAIESRISTCFREAGLARYFSAIKFHYSELEGLRDQYTRTFSGPVGPEGYMAGPTNQFFDIVRRFSAGMSHVALVEPDLVPIRANWLDAMRTIVKDGEEFWICGSHYRGVASIQAVDHINGNAIYNVGSPQFRAFFEQQFVRHFHERIKATPSLAYDLVLYDMFKSVHTGTAKADVQSLWKDVATKFRFTELVVDVSHGEDRSAGRPLTLAKARARYPSAYMLHGAVDALLAMPSAAPAPVAATVPATEASSQQPAAAALPSTAPRNAAPVLAYMPTVSTQEDLLDILSRAAWFLSFCDVAQIQVPVADASLAQTQWDVAAGMDPAIAQRLEPLREKVKFLVQKAGAEFSPPSDAIVLRWKADSAQPGGKPPAKVGKRTFNVDPRADRQEGGNYIDVSFSLLPHRDAVIEESKRRFAALKQRLGKPERAYVMATGPSVSTYRNFDYRNAVSIVCNSVIQDEELMDHVQPRVLVFADPIFHFGPSQYAARFRETLRRAVERYDLTICIPIKYYALFISTVPELESRTIALPFVKEREFNFDLSNEFMLKTTANILTFLLVPIAASIAKEVGIMGCDGRPLTENNYFWKHNPKTQFNEQMRNIQEVHPGFFSIDYNDYYLEHCDTLAKQLDACEASGKRVHSLGFSHIPALRQRFARGVRLGAGAQQVGPTTVLFLDPDGVTKAGHYMAYNERVEQAFAAPDTEVKIVCRHDIDPALIQGRPNYLPVLTAHSWEIGNRRYNEAFTTALEKELFPIVEAEIAAGRQVLIYLYFGSIEHTHVLAKLTSRYPQVGVNVNLHYTSYRISAAWWQELWRPWMRWTDLAAPRVTVTVPTAELQADIADAFGCIVDVAPHPSTGIDDRYYTQVVKERPVRALGGGPIKVLFPSAPTAEKGYAGSIACAQLLAAEPGIRCTLRHAPKDGSASELAAQVDALEVTADVVRGVLTDADFIRLFESTDMVVLPYSPEGFAKRTSGLLIDAIYCGVPAVVVEGTWLARIVQQHDCGVVVASADPQALRDGVLALKAERERYSDKARKASKTYFERNSWAALAASVRSPLGGADQAASPPRLLMIDLTPVGGLAATGRIKEAFLRGWDASSVRIAHYGGTPGKMCCSDIDGERIGSAGSMDDILAAVRHFDPQVVYYRAVDNDTVHKFAERAARELTRPLVVHIMDDWPARLQSQSPQRYAEFDRSLRELLHKASVRLAIGDDMADVFGQRYGVPFRSLANAVDPASFPPRRRVRKASDDFVIRYTGALAEDMTFASVAEIAHAVEALPEHLNARLVIHTRPPWSQAAQKAFAQLRRVSVVDQIDAASYYAVLQDADALLIAYNFDEASRTYVGLSMANKMPEYLATGTPVIAYGPADASTIRYLGRQDAALVITQRSALLTQLQSLITDEARMRQIGDAGRDIAFRRHSVWDIAAKFRQAIATAGVAGTGAKSAAPAKAVRPLIGPFDRSRQAHWDETEGISRLFNGPLRGATMIDVGAHHGSALMPFLNKGWNIYAFEPDAKNRGELLTRLSTHSGKDRVSIDIRAVTNKAATNISFFRSDVSTGISGLSAFHESHRESQRVDSTTLREFIADRGIETIDFLKIDTEGHDLFVLQGFPWEHCRPVVVECEFEDSKTVPLGYTYEVIADYLVAQGYTVYVSEWHPIIRYGIRHDWRRLVKYPCSLAEPTGWGNMIAFREPVDERQLVTAVSAELGIVPPARTISAQAQGTGFSQQPARVKTASGLTPVGPGTWKVVERSTQETRRWYGTYDAPPGLTGRSIAGSVKLTADADAVVRVTLCRDGDLPYEGNGRVAQVKRGRPTLIQVAHCFRRNHEALRVQVDVVAAAGSTTLTVAHAQLLPVLPASRNGHAGKDHSLAAANRLFREGDLIAAMSIYKGLASQSKLRIYDDNARMCASRLGLPIQ